MEFKKVIQLNLFKGLMLLSINPLFSQNEVFKGQEPAKEVTTTSKKIDDGGQSQFSFNNGGLIFGSDFLTGRINKVSQENDSSFTALISAENYPVNTSPWYAFYIVGNKAQQLSVALTYEQSGHRYHPKISKDGKNWSMLDSSKIVFVKPGKDKFGPGSMPASAILSLNINKGDTLWVAAQEIVSSKHVYTWINELPKNKKINQGIAGKSVYGKTIPYFTIGKIKKNKPSIVIISRQHPPEVTGYFAMQKFVGRLLSSEKLSRNFRKQFVTYVVPLMNPDGVDQGHWRHNAGGIDLNRDWQQQYQPEVKQVNRFIDSAITVNSSKILFFIDFHSTWDDIFYTNSVTHSSNLPGLMDGTLDIMEKELQMGKLNIRPSEKNESFVSKGYFYNTYKAESVTYEVGDNTSREVINKKGQLAADGFLKTLFRLYK
jgi:cytosolic carboxypeptidase protein 6